MVGRKQEIARLKYLIRSKRSEFLAITGRRRVGKTFLIDNTLQDHYCYSITGIQKGSLKEQLINFGVKLGDYDGTGEPKSPSNWQTAFLQLKSYLQTLDRNRKQVIFIDEMPWISTPRSGFLQMLAHLWNDYLSKESHFLLVVCGSATSWITKKIINDPGGLHNRVTETIHLSPFSLSETKTFLKSKGLRFSDQEIARIYMALGGIPFYLEKINKGESFAVAIERICFSPQGILRNEYDNLYKALFKHADLYQQIVAILAKHPHGIPHAKILKELPTTSTGSYQRAMQDLIVSDFVMETNPFGKKKRGTFYRLVDEYSVFYHHFIAPNRKYTQGIWQQLASSQSYKIWAGYAFESLCHKHIDALKRALGISAVRTDITSLHVPSSEGITGFQIDLLIDRKDDSINLCEVKFHAGPFTISKTYYRQLIQKRQRFIDYTGTRKQVFITFITNHGIAQNEYSSEIVEAELLLEDIIDP